MSDPVVSISKLSDDEIAAMAAKALAARQQQRPNPIDGKLLQAIAKRGGDVHYHGSSVPGSGSGSGQGSGSGPKTLDMDRIFEKIEAEIGNGDTLRYPDLFTYQFASAAAAVERAFP